MITLKNYVAAFLRNDDKYLLMKRADNRKINPGFWSGVGGHIEPHEINNPLSACYREIEEESGIYRDKIASLDLLYIITRRSKSEIRQNYIYFGKTNISDVIQTDEGVLFWIPSGELLEREYTVTYAVMLEHYIKRNPNDRAVYVGIAGDNDGALKMNWSICEDFER
jgi:8-oxo-dGTP diphosphatase